MRKVLAFSKTWPLAPRSRPGARYRGPTARTCTHTPGPRSAIHPRMLLGGTRRRFAPLTSLILQVRSGAFAAQQPQHHAWGWGFPVHRACICRGQLCGWSAVVPSGLPWVYDIVRMHVYVHVEVVIGDAPCVDDVWRCPRMRDRALSGRESRDVDMHWRE